MSGKVKLVVPEAPVPATAAAGEQRKFAAGGLRLGILDNSKGNADHLLAFLIEGLRAEMPVRSVVTRRKPSASRPADDKALEELAEEADCVISAMAD